MQAECAALPQQWTVGQALDYLHQASDLPRALESVFVVDGEGRLAGRAAIDLLLRLRRSERLSDVLSTDAQSIPASTSQAEVVRRFRRYGLVSAPVVDREGRILGQITVDDVLDVLDAGPGLRLAWPSLASMVDRLPSGTAVPAAIALGVLVVVGLILIA
jgi:magnesium transporter